MAYFKVSQKTSQLNRLREKGVSRGENTGFDPLDVNLSIKKGYPIFVAGAPHHGKTELMLEVALNLSVLKGWKWFIYLGENGEIEEVIAELCFKYICKPFIKKGGFEMDEKERIQAEMFLDEHFVFCDDSKEMKLSEFYEECKKAEKEFNIKFDGTIFDPFNDAEDESVKLGGTHHWLNKELKMVRKISKENNRSDVLINHIADLPTSYDKETGSPYLRMALPTEWAMGRMWHRRGFLMLLIYRPPEWLKDEYGMPYGKNVTLVCVQKAKPKGVAINNTISKVFWDWKLNRYFWEDNGIKKFAFMINEPKEFKSKALNEAAVAIYQGDNPF